MLMEVSNPFMHGREILKELKLKDSSLSLMNDVQTSQPDCVNSLYWMYCFSFFFSFQSIKMLSAVNSRFMNAICLPCI